ncbi:MAG: serine/threonine-protein kinase, partial [Gemmatimonadota bacterium]
MSERDQDRVEELYEQARALGDEARISFLAAACGGDTRLEHELMSLLELGGPAEAFFATLADAVVSPSMGHQVGHYRLVGMLGSGGMGTVYRAHDDRLDRTVALKFLPPYLSAQPDACERFRGEARAAAALDHPNVCSIYEIGETADGRPFIAMACYDGETLKERLSRAPMPPNEAIRIALALGHGLGAAHARGIVHRDVKPGNVMLCADGTVRLLDFGLAKVADTGGTGPGVTLGTIAYMAPEQARGDHVDARADLWSLGVVLYEMLAGMRPFRGGNDRAVIEAILHATPDPLPKLGEAQAFISPIVSRLLQKAPDNRYQGANELVRDLARGAPPRTATKLIAGLLGAVALLSLGFLVLRPRPV